MAAQSDERVMISVRDLVIAYGSYTAVKGVSFDVRRGEHLTLLGPSGCGKTTTLRSIAGLERPIEGSITLDGKTVYSSAMKVNLPAEKRGVSMVFQSYAIWPHMSVFENVAYGLRVRKTPEAELKEKVMTALDLVQLGAFADRPASKLSGGQQQRVALGRAIAFSPNIVLFDEPLSNLDAKLRGSMRVELRELQRKLGISSVYVTHDQEEAFAISDKVIVMKDGNIEQVGTPDDIYSRPATTFVADFVGSANLIPGRVAGISSEGTFIFETSSGARLSARNADVIPDKVSKAIVRTALIEICADNGQKSGQNIMRGNVVRKMFHGDFVEYHVDCSGQLMTVRRPPGEAFHEAQPVVLSFAIENTVPLTN